MDKVEKKKKGNKANISTASEAPVKGIPYSLIIFIWSLKKISIWIVDEGPARKKSSKKSVAVATTPESSSSFGLTTIGHSADVLDMPVDPNEPTYCLCHQVSYGEMIGCDNPDVNHEKIFMLSNLLICIFFLFVVSNWMVSFCLCQPNNQTEGEMVLSEMFRRSKKKVKNGNLYLYLIVIAHWKKQNSHTIIGF